MMVKETLDFYASFCLPKDAASRSQRVASVLAAVGLQHAAETLVSISSRLQRHVIKRTPSTLTPPARSLFWSGCCWQCSWLPASHLPLAHIIWSSRPAVSTLLHSYNEVAQSTQLLKNKVLGIKALLFVPCSSTV
jgi:hypothetical protein